MKKTLLIIFTFLTMFTKAQISYYHPMLDSVNRWAMICNLVPVSPRAATNCGYPINCSNSTFVTGTDTTVNSVVYKTLNEYYSAANPCFIGLIREDTSTKRIYFMDNNFGPEVLLYDFNMHIGDSINLLFYSFVSALDYWKSGYYSLTSIDSVNTLQGNRKLFHLNCSTCSGGHELTWLEGVGNLCFPVYTIADNMDQGGMFGSFCAGFPHNLDYFVSCFEHDQKAYFDSCAFSTVVSYPANFQLIDSCEYYIKGSLVSGLDFSTSIELLPNPVHSIAELKIIDQSDKDYNLRIYDLAGRSLHETTFAGQRTFIDMTSNAPGIYFYSLKDGKGRSANGRFVVE